MFRKLVTVCLLIRIYSCHDIDLNICPDGLTPSPSDSRWPKIFPNHFEILAEITTDVEVIEMTQLFVSPHRDVISLRNSQTNLQIFYDFQLNEKLIINEGLDCTRSEIETHEYLPLVISQFVKPSILLGFNGRNNYSESFYTRYIGKEIIRGGILTKKFQSCFYIDQPKLTINATYYVSDALSNEIERHTASDIVQIDVQSSDFPYTYNIIRFTPNPLRMISTPSGAYCANRKNTKEFPHHSPVRLSLHAEAYTLESNTTSSKLDSYNRLIDQTIEFERVDYSMKNRSISNRLLVDYLTNLSYIYTYETEQCRVLNTSAQSMKTVNELLFQIDTRNDSIEYYYTGLSECGREYMKCHRWIGKRDMKDYIQQYEWYWSAKYNDFDLKESIPIKVNLQTTLKNESPTKIIKQEISIFNYNPWPNSIEAVDSILGQCYRALGPIHQFNYAILRFILNNDEKHPVHRYLLSLKNRIHFQLANDLLIRHIRLSSFVIDDQDQDISVTFTLLDNPIGQSNLFREPSSLELIQQLATQINNGKFYVRIVDGAFDLQARPDSLQTLVLYLLPTENHTYYSNETVFIYQNITEKIVKQRQIFIDKHIGSQTIALWTGCALLSLIVTLVVGFFLGIRKWTPITHHH